MAKVIGIFSRTGTKRNLSALRAAKWHILVSCAGVWRTEGFDDWVAENGCYTDFTQGLAFDPRRFARFIRWIICQPKRPHWIALPDVVMGGEASLDRSLNWLRWLRKVPSLTGQRYMLVVQNGMDECPEMMERIKRVIGPDVGIFIGGDTEWKLRTRPFWARLVHSFGGKCHVGRVNSAKRIEAIGPTDADDDSAADSYDGSGVSRFIITLSALERTRRDQVARGSQLTFSQQWGSAA